MLTVLGKLSSILIPSSPPLPGRGGVLASFSSITTVFCSFIPYWDLFLLRGLIILRWELFTLDLDHNYHGTFLNSANKQSEPYEYFYGCFKLFLNINCLYFMIQNNCLFFLVFVDGTHEVRQLVCSLCWKVNHHCFFVSLLLLNDKKYSLTLFFLFSFKVVI